MQRSSRCPEAPARRLAGQGRGIELIRWQMIIAVKGAGTQARAIGLGEASWTPGPRCERQGSDRGRVERVQGGDRLAVERAFGDSRNRKPRANLRTQFE
jgi:hypothetical protein